MAGVQQVRKQDNSQMTQGLGSALGSELGPIGGVVGGQLGKQAGSVNNGMAPVQTQEVAVPQSTVPLETDLSPMQRRLKDLNLMAQQS